MHKPLGPILLSIAAATAFAADRRQIPPVLTLPQAVEMALESSPSVKAAEERAGQADARARAARNARLPEASFTTFQSDQTDNLRAYGIDTPLLALNSAPFSTFDARVEVTYNVWDPARSARWQALRLEAQASGGDRDAAREALIADVNDAFLAVLYGQDVQRALDRQAAVAAEFLKIARDRFDKGDASALEPNRADQEGRSVRKMQLEAAAALRRSQISLALLLNAQPGTAFEAAGGNTSGSLPSSSDALRLAFQSRREYRAALARVDAARSAASAVRAKRLPTAQVHVDSGFSGVSPVRGIGTYRALVSLQLPLFQPAQAPEETEAEHRLSEAQAAADQMKATIEAEVSIALSEASASLEEGTVAQEIRDLAQQELDLASRRFTAGITDNTEVLGAQDRLLRAEGDLARSRFEFRRHRDELYRKMGRAEDIYRP